LYTFLISLMCYISYVTLLHLTAVIIFGEEYKLRNSLLCIFLVLCCYVKYENKLWWLWARISWAQLTVCARLGYSVFSNQLPSGVIIFIVDIWYLTCFGLY
jgi:hypothetical protein